MPPPDNNKLPCPYCGHPFYPLWNAQSFDTKSPDRSQDIMVGQVRATTCTSCDKLIIELEAWDDSGILPEEWDRRQIFPAPPEVVIEIIVKVFIDLENLRRRQESEPEMTDDEEDAQRTSMQEFFKSAWEAVKTGGEAAQVIRKYLPFFETIFPQLPPPS